MKFRTAICVASLMALAITSAPTFAGTTAKPGSAFISPGGSGGDVWHTGVRVMPQSVDGKSVSLFLKKEAEVPAGNHVVALQIEFQGTGNFNYSKYRDVIKFRALLAPGRHYVSTARQSGQQVEVWIMDAETQQLASKVLWMEMQPCQLLHCPRPTMETRSELSLR